MLLTATTLEPAVMVGIIVFVLFVIVAVIYDRKKAASFCADFFKQYQGKILEGDENIFVTTDGQLVMKMQESTRAGYYVYDLKDVAYVLTCYDSYKRVRMWVFELYDSKKKLIKGALYVSTKRKPEKARAHRLVEQEATTDYLYELVRKYLPEVKRVGMYFKEYQA